MSCQGCRIDGEQPRGCNSHGGCSTGGCNRLNTYDWLAVSDFEDPTMYKIVEVSFKNGSRKEFYYNPPQLECSTGDMVVVEAPNGYDIGRVSLSGELVRLQLKKKEVSEDTIMQSVLRRANERDLERLQEARDAEIPTMIQARAIARSLSLNMKIGDVEFQGDKRKATFYYTADGRVDFRELIRHYAKDFKVKIEMRQIGARQESARLGGIGSCGRELCCSTWLSDFKSVSTTAARYQNLAINQSKLSGQCGRLKCCLNYELDTYMDAIDEFPKEADRLQTQAGTAVLMKTDIFKRLMYYAYESEGGRGAFYALEVKKVREILAMNIRRERPADLQTLQIGAEEKQEDKNDYADVTGAVELPPDQRKRKKKKRGGQKPADLGVSASTKSNPTNVTNKPQQQPNSKPPQRTSASPRPNNNEPKNTASNADRPRNADRKPNQPKNSEPRTPNNNDAPNTNNTNSNNRNRNKKKKKQ